MRYLLFLLNLIGLSLVANAQKNIDRVAAVIGDEIILTSDIDNQYNYLINANKKDDGELRCQAFEALIFGKILLNKARQDSLTVTEDEITGEVERRVAKMVEQVENETNFEKIVGKSVARYKLDIRPMIEEELLADMQRNKVLANADVTPKEVRDFFQTIPLDSLGVLPAEVEVSHIVAVPPFSAESKKAAKEKLANLRAEIVDKKADFTEMAKKYSQEPGASRTGGNLGEFSRGMMVPEFEAMAYSMRPGEISPIVETDFGYHIIKLLERRGETVNAQHILMIPKRDVKGDSIAIARLQQALDLINKDSLTFEEAAIRFSQERESKDCGGCIQNQKTGELRIPLQQLDAGLFFTVDEMKKGEISKPIDYTLPNGNKVFHIVYLKNKLPPHRPNLKDDYKKIYNVAVQAKQAKELEKWMDKARKNTYVDIKTNDCKKLAEKWSRNN